MIFIVLLGLITFSIAGCAAFFSIYGLAQTFGAAALAVTFMGAALEAGKLITASFLYRYWNKITLALKIYLCIAVGVLMIITSIGIFAFLSKGYQEDTLSLKELNIKIGHLEEESKSLTDRKLKLEGSKDTVVDSVANITDNTKRWQATAKNQLAKTIVGEDRDITSRLQAITPELNKLKEDRVNIQLHVGPIIYIAEAVGVEVDDATKYIILLLIIVFDPLAIALTIGVNAALLYYKEEQLIKIALLNTPSVIDNVEIPSGPVLELHPQLNELVNRKQVIERTRIG